MQSKFKEESHAIEAKPPASSVRSATTLTHMGGEKRTFRSNVRWKYISRWLQTTFFSPGVLPAPWSSPGIGSLFGTLGQVAAALILSISPRTIPILRFPSALMLLVVLLTALGWGVGSSLLATLVGAGLLLFFIFPPILSSGTIGMTDVLAVVPYVVVGLTISLLISQVQRERLAAQALARHLETIIETLPDPLAFYDREGRATRYNKSAREKIPLENYYLALEQMPQKPGLRNAEGETSAFEDLPLSRALRGEQVIDRELHFFPLQGSPERIIAVSAAPLRSLDGKTIEGAITITHDLTVLRQAEQEIRERAGELERTVEALRMSEERYRTIVETANEGILLVDTQGSILYANERMGQLLGKTQEGLVGQTILELIFPEDEMATKARVAHNVQGHAEQFEFRFKRGNGHVLETLASTSPLRDTNGAIVGVLGLFTDLTARKQIEEALQQSETFLHMAIRNSPIAIFQQDRDLHYTWMDNPPSFTPEAIAGKVDADFVSAEEAKHLTQIKEGVIRSGEGIQEEIGIGQGEGKRWELLTIEPLRNREGEIVGISGTSINITEQKRLEEERERLAQQAQMRANELEAVFEAMTDAIMVFDREGHIIRMNQSAKELLRRYKSAPSRTAAKQELYIVHQDTDRHILIEDFPPIARMLQGETLVGAHSQDVEVTTYEGEQLFLNMAGGPLRDTNGRQVGAVAVTRDLTEQRKNEIAAKEAKRMMEEFLGIVGHELRTPLTSIKASVQLARRNLNRIKQKEESLAPEIISLLTNVRGLLERTERQISLQNRLVGDLLDISRIQAGRLELHPRVHNIGELVSQIVEDQQSLTPERMMTVEIPVQSRLFVVADEDRIRQVITNYLSNALKYSNAEAPVVICVEVVEPQRIRVSVSDKGPGLSEEQQERIWERFYRVPDIEVRSGSGVGLGLGLPISRMLIERQGGQVGIESQTGQGSKFWFTLPLAETEEKEEAWTD